MTKRTGQTAAIAAALVLAAASAASAHVRRPGGAALAVVAAVIVGLFAIFHGHAHGTELPEAANPFAYAIGFVVATGLLHLIGIGFGALVRWPAGKIAVRAGGGAIALAGVAFLTRVA